MFGLEQVSWKEFLTLIILLLLFWYLKVLLTGWRKEKKSRNQRFYELDSKDQENQREMKLLEVSQKDFSSQLIPSVPGVRIASASTFYEETGMDEGYDLDYFLGGNEPGIFSVLSKIQCE